MTASAVEDTSQLCQSLLQCLDSHDLDPRDLKWEVVLQLMHELLLPSDDAMQFGLFPGQRIRVRTPNPSSSNRDVELDAVFLRFQRTVPSGASTPSGAKQLPSIVALVADPQNPRRLRESKMSFPFSHVRKVAPRLDEFMTPVTKAADQVEAEGTEHENKSPMATSPPFSSSPSSSSANSVPIASSSMSSVSSLSSSSHPASTSKVVRKSPPPKDKKKQQMRILAKLRSM